MANVLDLSKGLQNFTYPRTDSVVIMIAIDETGDKVLLGRGVRQLLKRLILNSLILYRRKGLTFTRLWLVLLNRAKHLKMQFPERCGKRLGFAFGMWSITLVSHGSALRQEQFPTITEFYCSPSLPTSWSDFMLGLIQRNLYAQIWITNLLVNTTLSPYILLQIWKICRCKMVYSRWSSLRSGAQGRH